MDKSLKEVLEAKFTQKDLFQRVTSSGQTLTYIRSAALVDRLNRIYGHGGWSFEVLDHDTFSASDGIVVRGRLQVPGAAYVQYGNASFAGRGFSRGDSLKSATSDCLARCAYLLGIGAYLRRRKRSTDKTKTKSSPEQHHQSPPEQLSKRQLTYLLCLASSQNISASSLDTHCQHTYGAPANLLSKQEASALIDNLRSKHFELYAA